MSEFELRATWSLARPQPASLVRQKPSARPGPHRAWLQAHGNQAVQRMIRSAQSQARPLAAGQPDVAEREAERVAEAVARSPEVSPSRERFAASLRVQSSIADGACWERVPELRPSLEVVGSGGRPLPEHARAFFEPRFGYDFGRVRVHTGSQAAEAAERMDALAFTFGNHIVFGAGQYAPETVAGRKLLAHELTHVVQQGAAHAPDRPLAARSWHVQRAAPAAAVGIGALVAKCIIGAITGALFDAAIQAALNAWRRGSWRFWEGLRLNYCSIILSAILGCIAAPISARILEPWITARLGTRLGGIAGPLIGKVLLFIAKKLAMAIPKGIVGKLLKLGCISEEQAAELGVPTAEVT